MRRIAAALLLFAALLAGPALGQSQNAPTDPAVLAEARKLMGAIKAEELMTRIMPMINVMIGQMMIKANPGEGAKIKQALDELFMPEFKAQLPTFVDEMAKLYARHYTLEDLQQLNAFYQSPVGQKVVRETPQLSQEGMILGQLWGRRMAESTLEKLAPKFRERGLNL